MSSILIQLCPLCGKASEAKFIDSSRRKRIKCKACNEFVITSDAERHPRMSHSDLHKELSEIARSSSKIEILDISVKGHKLHWNHVLRSNLFE